MNFQVAHMCIILHINFVHIAFIAVLLSKVLQSRHTVVCRAAQEAGA